MADSTKDIVKILKEYQISSEKKKRLRSKKVQPWNSSDLTLTAWKFEDHAYYKADLPTNARGLFTYNDKIALRGFDKFFNTDEVPQTKWTFLEKNTIGPYELTVKENGCLIMISGVNGQLVVTSKHTTGPIDNVEPDNVHSYVALKWVRRYLERSGKSEKDLVKELESRNLTAVGELCDDDFEEHVLAYTPENAGIYIIGLNHNEDKFRTESPASMHEFANKFGFKVVEFLTKPSLTETREFLENCAETGAWNDQPIEGFVVRCKRTDGPTPRDFFFKYKFQEPYLMYRSWREATKAYIRNSKKLPNFPVKHKESCRRYWSFLHAFMPSNHKYMEMIPQGKGIIELRDKFLESQHMSIQDMLCMASDKTKKYVLVTVSTLGCGKTTVGLALQQLLGCAIVQNDDIPGSGPTKRAKYIRNAIDSLHASDVLVMDRNNHLKQEREQLIADMTEAAEPWNYDLTFICLNFLPQGITPEIKRITSQRVFDRKQHQTIMNLSSFKVRGIMQGFINRFEPVNRTEPPDNSFTTVIDLDIAKGSETAVTTVLCELKKYDIGEVYNKASIKKAVLDARSYTPLVLPQATKKPQCQFFGFGVSLEPQILKSQLDKLLGPKYPKLWRSVRGETDDAMLKNEFHVTVAHPQIDKKAFNDLLRAHKAKIDKQDGEIELGQKVDLEIVSLCFNDRIMAARVQVTPEFPSIKLPHITIALKKGVAAKEAIGMFQGEHTEVKWDIEPKLIKDVPLIAYKFAK